MRLLTATRRGQGDGPKDFSWGPEGELVLAGANVCDRDRAWPGNFARGCGCGWSFTGISTGAATTTAVVADVDITTAQLHDVVRGWATGLGLGIPEPEPEDVEDLAEEMRELGQVAGLGGVVRWEWGRVLSNDRRHVLHAEPWRLFLDDDQDDDSRSEQP